MFRLIIFLFLISNNLYAENFALIAGGSDHDHEDSKGALDQSNMFLNSMSELANGLEKKSWKTKVLFDSDFDAKEWDKLNRELRPKKKGDPAFHFSLQNFNRSVDEILNAGAKKNDQVLISLHVHGGVLWGRHVIGWRDSRGKRAGTSLAELAKDAFNPTKEIMPKLEELLNRGVVLNLNIYSCYSGQVLKDLQSLLKKYPGQICLVTSTSSDRVSYNGELDNFLAALTRNSSAQSIQDIFEKYQKGSNQISSLPGWEKSYQRLDVIDYNEQEREKQVVQNFCAFSKLLYTLPLSAEQLKFIVEGTVIPARQSQRDCTKYQEICSDKFIHKISSDYSDEIQKLNTKYEWILVDVNFKSTPHLIVKQGNMNTIQTSQFDLGLKSGGSSFLLAPQTIVQILNQDTDRLSSDEKKGLFELKQFISKSPEKEQKIKQYEKSIAELKEKYKDRICDVNKLNDSLIKLKNILLEQNVNSPEAKGCQNFKI